MSASVKITGKTISIHSLRMEGDKCGKTNSYSILISIHSLRMEGDGSKLTAPRRKAIFQSTPSAWRETRRSVGCW